MQLALKFRNMLPNIVREELDSLVAMISGFFAVQHKADGTHGAITCDSITCDSILVNGTPITGGGGAGSLPTTTKGDLIAHDGVTNVRVPVGSVGRVLSADPSAAPGMSWQTPATVPTVPLTAKGDLLSHNGTLNVRVPIGGDGMQLTADSVTAAGVSWQTQGLVPITRGGTGQITKAGGFNALAPPTTKGDLIAHDGSNNVRVPVGTTAYLLTADAASAGGVKWQGPDLAIPGKFYEQGRATALGEWITIPYSAGIFTASGSMTWAVPGAPQTLAYALIGRTAMVFFNITGTIGGTASTDLFVTLPFNPTGSVPGFARYGTGGIVLLSYLLVGQSKMGLQLNAGGNMPLGTTNIQGTAFCQV